MLGILELYIIKLSYKKYRLFIIVIVRKKGPNQDKFVTLH